MTRRIHLDLVGGIAGDMFVSSLLDLLADEILFLDIKNIIQSLDLTPNPTIFSKNCNDGVLTGKKFQVSVKDGKEKNQHRRFSDIRTIIDKSTLCDSAKHRAIDIFYRLAVVEGRIHGVDTEEVTFHEVGAVDSIVDICVSAFLIDHLGDCDWSVSDIPLGSGFIESQHGLLPIPTPATLELLRGFKVSHDLVQGERVTPTGAALLAHLNASQESTMSGHSLGRIGYGFGTKRFSGFSNIIRSTEYLSELKDELSPVVICQVNFEVDDQTPEDLAQGLDNIRSAIGVMDVILVAGFGKKGRMNNVITVLVNPENKDTVISECFEQTTTIGLRYKLVNRVVLDRQETTASNGVLVKSARRLSAITAKADSDSIGLLARTANARMKLRHEAENDSI